MDIAPLFEVSSESGKVKRIERFGEYVVRQLQIPPDHATGPALAQAADDYLGGDKSKSDKSRENLINLVCNACSVESCDGKHLADDIVSELDSCMMSYFAFHWNEAPLVIQQIFSNNGGKRSKLRDAVLSATRFQRIQRVMSNLKAQREISFLLEELKSLKQPSSQNDQGSHPESHESNGGSEAANSKRKPVLLLMGGGMGAGKSTVVKELMNSPSGSKIPENAVIVEADAFKEKDVIYKTLSNGEFGDITQASQLVHESSTRAASSMLVSALNQGRDVVFDGTMSWKPFVFQTIEMARQVHKQRFRLGPGYEKHPDGSVSECYWTPVDREEAGEEEEEDEERGKVNDLPYQIELVGVVCDAHLAVVRGMRRTILTGRAVPVNGQLRSHKLFASSVEEYCQHVDKATIFSTNAIGGLPEIIGWKEKLEDQLKTTECFKMVHDIASINVNASNIFELFPSSTPPPTLSPSQSTLSPSSSISSNSSSSGVLSSLETKTLEEGLNDQACDALSVWQKVVRSPERSARQQKIRSAFIKLQACAWVNPRNLTKVSSASFFSHSNSFNSLSDSSTSSIPDQFHDQYVFGSDEAEAKISS